MAKASQFLLLKDRRNKRVDGESIDADHFDEIEINSWAWSVADPAHKAKDTPAADPAQAGAGAPNKPAKPTAAPESEADAKLSPDLFTLSKRLDKSTVRLMQAMDTGEVFPTAKFVVEEEFKESPNPFYLEINLTDVFVVKLDMNVDAGSGSLDFKENWSLTYSKVKFSYRLRGERKSKARGEQGAMFDMDFDRPRGSKATPSRKSPPTASEKAAAKKQEKDEWMKEQQQRQDARQRR